MLPYNVKKLESKKHGTALPYCLSSKKKHCLVGELRFFISEIDYIHLSDDYVGSGRCYAYFENFDVWCEVRIYKYWVVSFTVVKDADTIRQIEEDILS